MMAQATALTPATVEITPRRMDFQFPAETPRYWLDRDPWRSHLMNALSLTFPQGEKMFVEAVRAFRDRITDPKLSADIRGFIGQEAMHSQEHSAFNEWLRTSGVDVDAIYAQVDARIQLAQGRAPKEVMLAITCALEHFTATVAAQLLRRDDWNGRMNHPTMRQLWLWHAIEESEHKAVAYDVYQKVGGGYVTRATWMVLATAILAAVATDQQVRLMKQDGELFNLRSWSTGLWNLFGYRGFMSELTLQYLDYFRPGFHPNDHDSEALEKKWKAYLALKD